MARPAGSVLAEADDAVGGSAGIGPTTAYSAAMTDLLDDAVLTENTADFEALGIPTERH